MRMMLPLGQDLLATLLLTVALSRSWVAESFVPPAPRRSLGKGWTRAAATPVDEESTASSDNDSTTSSDTTGAPLLPHAFIAEKTRPDFSILQTAVTEKDVPIVYLDSGATSQKPDVVLETLDSYYKKLNSNVHRGAHTLSRQATAAYEQARQTVADFISADSPSEIVFTSGATEAINLVVQSYGRSRLQPGDEIVLTVAEHHSNLVPWQMLAQELDLKLHFVQVDPETGSLDQEQFLEFLSEKTAVVAFQHVSNVLGCVNPVNDMVAAVRSHAKDAVILLDACQSVPHMPVNVQELGVDFLVASGHKMCGPTGIGFLWGKYDLLEQMPPWKGGGEMIDQVSLTGITWQPPPARFEAGTPAIAQAIGLGAAMDYLKTVGMKEIEAYEHELGEYLYQKLSAVPGISIIGPRPQTQQRAGLAAFCHESVHPSDLSTFLDMDGIAIRAGHHCCQPLHTELGYSHSARASLYFYNTKEDVDAFIDSLQNTIKFFAGVEEGASGDGDSSTEDDFVPFI